MKGRGGRKRTGRKGQEERGEEGRLTESGTPHHHWWGGRHPFVRGRGRSCGIACLSPWMGWW